VVNDAFFPAGEEGELLVHEDDLQGGTGLLDLVALDADYDADMEETMEDVRRAKEAGRCTQPEKSHLDRWP
jgi:hypothetical protein